MPGLKNRVGLPLLLILLCVYLWEFYAKPASGSLFTAAVNEYRNRRGPYLNEGKAVVQHSSENVSGASEGTTCLNAPGNRTARGRHGPFLKEHPCSAD